MGSSGKLMMRSQGRYFYGYLQSGEARENRHQSITRLSVYTSLHDSLNII